MGHIINYGKDVIKVIFWGGLILAVYFVYSYYSTKVSGSDLTVYSFFCSNKTEGLTNLSDCQNAKKIDRTAYKINQEKGEVVSWNPDKTPTTYTTNKSCTIINNDNWRCPNEYYGFFGVEKGKYFMDGLSAYVLLGSYLDWMSLEDK